MIRLNDINKTVISERAIKGYSAFTESFNGGDVESISFIFTMGGTMARYDSKEARDKDIELLDKLFDVKSIEDKANEESKPSYDFGEPQVLNPEPNYVLGDSRECELEPLKPLKYLTWDYVKQSGKRIKAEMPNGDIRNIYYSEDSIYIVGYGDDWDGAIYEEYLFNALMLKKVE